MHAASPRSRSASRLASILCGLVLALVATRPARGQVNAEPLRPNPWKDGFGLGLDATLSLLAGNVDLFDVGGALRLQYLTLHPSVSSSPPWAAQRVALTGNGRFAQKNDQPIVSQAYTHARWTAMWIPRLGSDVFVQLQYNRFQRLELRALVGLGLRLELVHTQAFLLWMGSAWMLEKNKIDVQPGAPDRAETLDHRWTNYLSLRLAVLDGRLLMQNTVYAQPRFDAFGDVRVLEELEVLAKVTDSFALGLTFAVLYDSEPPSGVESTDLRLLNTVRLSL